MLNDKESPFTLTLTDSGLCLPVLRFSGEEALNQPYRFDIELIGLAPAMPPGTLLQQPVFLRLNDHHGVHGLIHSASCEHRGTAPDRLSTDRGAAPAQTGAARQTSSLRAAERAADPSAIARRPCAAERRLPDRDDRGALPAAAVLHSVRGKRSGAAASSVRRRRHSLPFRTPPGRPCRGVCR